MSVIKKVIFSRLKNKKVKNVRRERPNFIMGNELTARCGPRQIQVLYTLYGICLIYFICYGMFENTPTTKMVMFYARAWILQVWIKICRCLANDCTPNAG